METAMISSEYWKDFYSTFENKEPSSFAKFCCDRIYGEIVELGCGNGRDLYYFINEGKLASGVDGNFENHAIKKQTVEDYIKENKSPPFVYTRFFWHSIAPMTQEDILDWTSNYIFIEARTDQDKPKDLFGKHKRNLVNVRKLLGLLKDKGFDIEYFSEGYGFSPLKDEDPHLFRCIAHKRAVA